MVVKRYWKLVLQENTKFFFCKQQKRGTCLFCMPKRDLCVKRHHPFLLVRLRLLWPPRSSNDNGQMALVKTAAHTLLAKECKVWNSERIAWTENYVIQYLLLQGRLIFMPQVTNNEKIVGKLCRLCLQKM